MTPMSYEIGIVDVKGQGIVGPA